MLRLRIGTCSARLTCAAIARHETVGGWDLHDWRPKAALRAAPAGSVYWFDEFECDVDKLANWAALGMGADNAPMTARRAEGFNNVLLCNDWKEAGQ